MPSLEIAVAQPAFQNHLGTLRAQTPLHGNPFIFGLDKKLSSSWKSSDIMKKLNFKLEHVKTPKSRLLIQAVATFETKSLVHNENGHMGYKSSELDKDPSPWTVQPRSSREDSSEMDDKEKLRRMRISKENKGNTPWNKGRKHSPETLRLIKERTRLVMQDPTVMSWRNWCFSRSIEPLVSHSGSGNNPSTLKDLWKKISFNFNPNVNSSSNYNANPFAANAELVVDFVSNKMNKAWIGLEKAPEGSNL